MKIQLPPVLSRSKQPLCCVLIMGYPGSGKTTLAKCIAPLLGLPIYSRDDFKEILFDQIGSKDRNWSELMGSTSYELMWYVTESLLVAHTSCLLESNFTARSATKLREFQARFGVGFIQLILDCSSDILLSRFKQRWESGKRHPGHCDDVGYAELQNLFTVKPKFPPLDLPGEVIRVDTTHFEALQPEEISSIIYKHLIHNT
jgi:predicted kinase